MDWYCALTEHLLSKEHITIGNESFTTIVKTLEEAIIALYKALILYQMTSVCSYYKNQGLVFLRGLVNLDDWDGGFESVKNAEATVEKMSVQYYREYEKSSLRQLVSIGAKTEALLGNIYGDIQEFIEWQRKIQTDSENKDCLQAFRVVNPLDDIKRIEKEKENLIDDANKWILEDEKYAAFANWDTPYRLLWIKGDPGAGKTMLLIGIIRELSKQPAFLAPSLSYFFCQSQGKTGRPLNNAIAALRSLIWMLVIQQPHLISFLQKEYKTSGRNLFEDKNASVAVSRLFTETLKHAQPVYFIVDALDECDQGLEDLVELISSSLALSDKVRWLL
jgi:DNA replication protein DnaC